MLFPFYVRPPDTPEMKQLPIWKQLRHRAYYDFEWRRRLATYRSRCANSAYTREWTYRRWHIDTEVIHPPVDIDLPQGPKDNLVLSVGRFSTLAHTKKQAEMMGAFCELQPTTLGRWTYACVGGLNTREENHAYFERVRELGSSCSTIVEANLSPERLRELFGRSRIFWHATGLGEDAMVELGQRHAHEAVVEVDAEHGARPGVELEEHGRSATA